MRLLQKRAVLVTFGALGASTAVFYNAEISESGPFRIGRAGITVGLVASDYKWTMRRLKHLPADSPEYLTEKSDLHQRSARRLKDLCCRNRGAFIKVGQHLGSLDYILPPEYVETMRSLFRDAPQSPFDALLQVVKKELGQEPSEIFTNIERTPLGAASLAQVHKATLKDGSVVAVKIQHPKVEERSHMDIAAMDMLVKMVAKMFPDFQFLWLAEEMKRILPMELDFLQEGTNCERLGKLMSEKFDFVKLPKIFWNLSTSKVLTMEFCDGGRVDDLKYYQEHGISANEAYCKICQVFSDMTFREGYLHCDPHPGNILISKDSGGHPKITLLDHGVHQEIADETKISYARLWLSLLNRDLKGIEKYSAELGVGDLYGVFACMLTARSWEAVTEGVDRTAISSKEIMTVKSQIGGLLPQISQVLSRVPREILLILKTNDLLRGLSYKLNVSSSPCSFSSVSKACAETVFREDLRHAGLIRKPIVYFRYFFSVMKISFVNFYLRWFGAPQADLF